MSRRVRIGIDVGGTFTKAAAIDAATGDLLAKSTVPTTHKSKSGVAEGIVKVLGNILDAEKIASDDIEVISHSTTQAINALLESDTYKVGIIAMGVAPTRKDVTKRTRLDGAVGLGGHLSTSHAFLDTSHMITEGEVRGVVEGLRRDGVAAIVATEAFGVDDPSNEEFVRNTAASMGVPATASCEISGVYGLEIRTLTSTINASVLPKTFQVANYVEEAIRSMGVDSPLMVMKGDGGVTGMEAFRTKPILTILSGPAASVAGALLYLKMADGVFVEVGGTSTNICVIRGGKPEFRYVTVRDHPTCVRSMDVRILGVAGGSMVRIERGRISKVGPRSAHVAGLKYSCYADVDDIRTGEVVTVRPVKGDDEYVAVRCDGGTYAITNTCAANALDMLEEGDHSLASTESARIALKKLGERLGVSYFEAAQSIIQTSSFEITKAVTRALKDYKMKASDTEIIGGGGGASVLVPFAAKQLEAPYRRAKHADVISSIGVASSMLREEYEVSMSDPTPKKVSEEHDSIQSQLIERGAVPESIVIDSQFIPERSILRITAVGNVELDGSGSLRNAITRDEARRLASSIAGTEEAEPVFESDRYAVFDFPISERRILGRRVRHRVVVMDVFGRSRLSLDSGAVLAGDSREMALLLRDFLDSRRSEIMPRIYLVYGMKLMDFSGLTSKKDVLDAVGRELAGVDRGIILADVS